MPKLAARAAKRVEWRPESYIELAIHQPYSLACGCRFDDNLPLLRRAWGHWRFRFVEEHDQGHRLPEVFWEMEGPEQLRATEEMYSASGPDWSEVLLLRREALEHARAEWLRAHPITP